MAMPVLDFGKTGLKVSALGLGAGQIGDPAQDERDIERLLLGALDAGITLIDTARGYGLSEERIGRILKGHRQRYVLSTKVGYGIDGVPDWTFDCVARGVERALGVLATDCIDIVHLHSCPQETLERGEVIEALERARDAGKLRVVAYSGDNEALEYALACGRFASLEASFNFCDQRVRRTVLPEVVQRSFGFIAKRPLANAPWRFSERPVGNYAEVYWERMRTMGVEPGDLSWTDLALRFTAGENGVCACITGTASLEHLLANAAVVEKGPLPEKLAVLLRTRFDECDIGWRSEV
jgi:aryl-alcohol dehydrogenase-like predicted oxidoreductase